MPDIRALLIALGVGGGVAAYTLLWWHWPLALGIGAGVLLGGLALTGSTTERTAAAEEDAAWRAAASDLVDSMAVPSPSAGPRVARAPAPGLAGDGPPPRDRDRPSGD